MKDYIEITKVELVSERQEAKREVLTALLQEIEQQKFKYNHEALFSHRNGFCKCNFNSGLDKAKDIISKQLEQL